MIGTFLEPVRGVWPVMLTPFRADDSTPYEQRAPGMHKDGDYGYPHTLIHDGRLHVIVSRRKKAVEVLRVRFPESGGHTNELRRSR